MGLFTRVTGNSEPEKLPQREVTTMIPVRVRADAKPVLASGRRFAANRGHPLDASPCPVCDGPLGEQVSVLVLVGIAPEDRKTAGYTTGGAVFVHAACAGVPEEEADDDGGQHP